MASVLRYAVTGALFLIPFLPLYVANASFFPFITGKGFLFRILVEVALAAWAVLALMDARYRPRFSWMLVLYGALAAWMLIADLAGANPGKALWSNYERMDGFVTLIHAFLFFVVAGAFLTAERKWRAWWLAFIAGSGLVSLYGLLQIMGAAEIHQGGVRLDATFGNAAYLAAYLVFAIAITLWRAFESAGTLRYGLFALAALETLILFYTATRGAILGFVGASIVALALYAYESRGHARIVALGVLASVFLLVAGFMLVRDSSFVQENGTLARLASISLESGAPRLAIWNMAVEGVAERPLFGWGQEGFNYVFAEHYQPSMYLQEPWFDRAHNVYLDWAIAGGLPALLLFLALLVTAVVVLYARSAESSKAERVFFTAALAAYAFQALFVFDNLFTYVPLAAIFAMAHAARTRPLRAVERIPSVDDASATTIAAPVAIGLLVALLWFVNGPSMLAANRLVHALSAGEPNEAIALLKSADGLHGFGAQEIAEQAASYAQAVAASSAAPAGVKSMVASYAASLMGAQVEAHPKDPRIRLLYSNVLHAGGDVAGAIREAEEARALSPKKQQTIVQEGMFLWEAGRQEEAAALFDLAYDLDRSFPDLAGYAAAGKFITGKPDEARTLLLRTYGTTTVDHAALARAYFAAKRYDDLVLLWELRAREGGVEDKYQLAFAYKLAGRTADARAQIERTRKEYPESAAFAAQALIEIGKP